MFNYMKSVQSFIFVVMPCIDIFKCIKHLPLIYYHYVIYCRYNELFNLCLFYSMQKQQRNLYFKCNFYLKMIKINHLLTTGKNIKKTSI